jgi:hypothetical protein
MVGVAVKSAVSSCHAGNIAAQDHAMMDNVGPAKCVFLRDVTAVRYRKTFCVVTGQKRSRADRNMRQTTTPPLSRSGLAHLNAQISAVDHSIAASTSVRSLAIDKSPNQRIALDLPTL